MPIKLTTIPTITMVTKRGTRTRRVTTLNQKIKAKTIHMLQVCIYTKWHRTKIRQALLAPSNSLSICVHVFYVTETVVTSTLCVWDIFSVYSLDDPIWDCICSYKVLNDTVNSAKNMVCTNFTYQAYYDHWQDQQNSFYYTNSGIQQRKLELVPNIIIEEED